MNLKVVLATSKRLLLQLRHDPPTIALIFIVPCMLLTILKYVFWNDVELFHRIGPMMVGIFPMVLMFVVASVATLRERTAGTLDRLMVSAISRVDLVFGYALAFSFVALLQASLACFVMLNFLGVPVVGGALPLIIGAVLSAFLGVSLGLFVSAFAKTEFHAVQFMPAFLLPQFLTCGVLGPRDNMAQLFQWFADVMPLTYSVDGMKLITTQTAWSYQLTKDFLIVVICGLLALYIGAKTIRRQE